MDATTLLLVQQSTRRRAAARPVPIPRAPLPPFDRDTRDPDTGAPLPVRTTLNGTIPPPWTPGYMRADLWGLTLPGLPPIRGGAGGLAQTRMLTYLADRYPTVWLDRGLQAYGEHGYEQFWLSIPDSRASLSLGQYLDLTKRVLDAGLIPAHFLRSKDYDGRNPNPDDVAPWVDALAAIDGIPIAAHAWEASLWNSPASFREMIDRDARRWPQVQWCVHLQEGYADFGPDGPNHARDFWLPNIAVGVKTLLYQYNSSTPNKDRTGFGWTAGMMQARGNDVSVRLIKGGLGSLPETVDWVVFELCGEQLFNNGRDGDGRLATEDTANLKTFECLCTPGPLPPTGFGNGARYPDGRVL
jgi:hypothetical protein